MSLYPIVITTTPWRPVSREYITCPGFPTVTEAIDWLEARGCGPEVVLYRGSDGLVRGRGRRKAQEQAA